MATLKIANVHTLVTVDDDYRILHDVDVLDGGEAVDFPWKHECCGAYLGATEPETVSLRTREILSSAARRGAEAVEGKRANLCLAGRRRRERRRRKRTATAKMGWRTSCR